MKKLLKIVGIVLALLIAAIAVLVATSDQSAQGRLTRQFPFDIRPSETGPYMRVDMELDGCVMDLTTNQYSTDDQIITGQTLSVDLAQVDAAALDYKPGYVTGKLRQGQLAACRQNDQTPCENAQSATFQINLPRIAGTGKGDQYLGYVRKLVEECQS